MIVGYEHHHSHYNDKLYAFYSHFYYTRIVRVLRAKKWLSCQG